MKILEQQQKKIKRKFLKTVFDILMDLSDTALVYAEKKGSDILSYDDLDKLIDAVKLEDKEEFKTINVLFDNLKYKCSGKDVFEFKRQCILLYGDIEENIMK